MKPSHPQRVAQRLIAPLQQPTQNSALLTSNDIPLGGIRSDRENGIPRGFSLEADGLYMQDRGGAASELIRISDRLEVAAYARAPESDRWGKLLIWLDPDGRKHEHVMPMSSTQGDGLDIFRLLADGGLGIAPGIEPRRALIQYLVEATPKQRITLVSKTGWHSLEGQDVFVLPDRTLGQLSGDVQVRLTSSGAATPYVTSGSAEDWRDNVAPLCAGNSRLLVAVGSAFAAVLLHFTEIDGGGIHFLGTSSTGKTTAGHAALSVFGPPRQMQRWRATGNGIEAIAATHNSLLLVLDELGQVEPREAGEIAYMLSNGQGKQRSIRSGDAAARRSWRLLFLSTGEVGLSQHMATAGKQVRAGQEVRLVELQADAGKGYGLFDQLNGQAGGAALSEAIRATARSYHGAVGLEFIRLAAHNAKTLEGDVRISVSEFVQECKAEFTATGEFGGQA